MEWLITEWLAINGRWPILISLFHWKIFHSTILEYKKRAIIINNWLEI